MSESLYLTAARARNRYECPGCGRIIPRGSVHFRHDPSPWARRDRGERASHWCRECILASLAESADLTGSPFRVPAVRTVRRLGDQPIQTELPLVSPVRIEVVTVGDLLVKHLSQDPLLLHSLTPIQFEEFVCDRLFAMGFEPKQIGTSYQRDGGIDVVFWPRDRTTFPFLGAAQVKHHRNPRVKESSPTVREFAGSMAGHPFNVGLIVTNTSFSPDAEWFARERARLVRLRGFDDIRRWLFGHFGDDAEWREIPPSLELCPGVVVKIR